MPADVGMHLPGKERWLILQLHYWNIKGYTEADRSQYVGWEDWVEAACDAIREQVGVDQPFVLGGLCSGGMEAAAVAARGEFNVRTLVMMSPSFGYDGWARTIWWRLRGLGYALHLDQWISIKESPPYGIKNEKIRKWVERDMQQRATSAAGPSTLPLWAPVREPDEPRRRTVCCGPHGRDPLPTGRNLQSRHREKGFRDTASGLEPSRGAREFISHDHHRQ
jgi:pimeloyl-ACP methyl ester carboxylesterase